MDLKIGENYIGNEIDKNIKGNSQSKQAVTIVLSTDAEISIIPCAGVLCYIRSNGTGRWKLLKPDQIGRLNVKDICLLFPNKIWFKVINGMESVHENSSLKRKMEEVIDDELRDKKRCVVFQEESKPINCFLLDGSQEPALASSSTNFVHKNKSNVEINEHNTNLIECLDIDVNVHEELKSPFATKYEQKNLMLSIDSTPGSEKEKLREEDSTDNINSNSQSMELSVVPSTTNTSSNKIFQKRQLLQKQKKKLHKEDSTDNKYLNSQSMEPSVVLNTANTSSNSDILEETTTTKPEKKFKEKCKYGNECYRVNAEHKALYSHPGDLDYKFSDTRPECIYGIKCYRKNPQHKIEYKHTRNKRNPTRTILNDVSRQDLLDYEDSEESFDESIDESEYEPSFIDDDSLIEFESDMEEYACK